MPRYIPLGNGSLLVALDDNYQIRDIYWPHVGQENHALGHPFRMGVWVDGQFRWMEDRSWERSLRYLAETLVTDVTLKHPNLNIEIRASDAVDFHENLLVRRFEIRNLADHHSEVRLFFNHDFHIAGHEVGDTAYYEPDRRAVIHYKGARWFLINGATNIDSSTRNPVFEPTQATFPGLEIGLHQWACGLKEIRNLEGTWREAEAGNLALKMMATGGVYIGGGIPPRILSKIDKERFRTAYTNKGRFSGLLSKIPVHVIVRPDIALFGAACHGFEQLEAAQSG